MLNHESGSESPRGRVVLDPECAKTMQELTQEPSRQLPGLVAQWQGDAIAIQLASARESAVARPVPRVLRAPRRTLRVDWYALGVLLLTLSSAVAAVSRLLWAISP